MEAIKCDGCGKVAKVDQVFEWLQLEYFGLQLRSEDMDSGPWHFCNRACLIKSNFIQMKGDR